MDLRPANLLSKLRGMRRTATIRGAGLSYRALKRAETRALIRSARARDLLIPLPQLGLAGTARTSGRGRGTYARWEAVERRLRPGPGFALDLGSHSGFFSIALAERGYQVLGYEPDLALVRLAVAAAEQAGTTRVAFMPHAIDVQTARHLPQADVVLLLSVFHKWVEASDLATATDMLHDVWAHTRGQLFFEMPNSVENEKVGRFLPAMGSSADDAGHFIETLLGDLAGSAVTPLGHFPTDFRSGSEARHLFLVARADEPE